VAGEGKEKGSRPENFYKNFKKILLYVAMHPYFL
jgi:hypothetical protein